MDVRLMLRAVLIRGVLTKQGVLPKAYVLGMQHTLPMQMLKTAWKVQSLGCNLTVT